MLQAHYRSILDFSNDALLASEKGFNRLLEAYNALSQLKAEAGRSDFDVAQWRIQCYQAMNDDFNTPILIAHLFEAVKQINLIKEGKQTLSQEGKHQLQAFLDAMVYDVLGLDGQLQEQQGPSAMGGVMELLIQMRNEARDNKDFATSDKIRDRLMTLGIQLKDNKDGTTYSLK